MKSIQLLNVMHCVCLNANDIPEGLKDKINANTMYWQDQNLGDNIYGIMAIYDDMEEYKLDSSEQEIITEIYKLCQSHNADLFQLLNS